MTSLLYFNEVAHVFTNYKEIVEKYGKHNAYHIQFLERGHSRNCASFIGCLFANIETDTKLFDPWSLANVLVRSIENSLYHFHQKRKYPNIIMYLSDKKITREMFESSEEYHNNLFKLQNLEEKVYRYRSERKQLQSMYKNKMMDKKTYTTKKNYYHLENFKMFWELNCMNNWISFIMNIRIKQERNQTYLRNYENWFEYNIPNPEIKRWWRRKHNIQSKSMRMEWQMHEFRKQGDSTPVAI